MDVAVVREYLETKKQRIKLTAQLGKLEAEMLAVGEKETKLSQQVTDDCLITAKAVKVINELLSSHRPLRLGGFPVSFAHTTLKNGQLRVQIVFAQPLFSGWKTEIPHLMYQYCTRSLETPEPPDENHIPQYVQVMDGNWDVVCWERIEGRLRLWTDEKRGIEFKWEGE